MQAQLDQISQPTLVRGISRSTTRLNCVFFSSAVCDMRRRSVIASTFACDLLYVRRSSAACTDPHLLSLPFSSPLFNAGNYKCRNLYPWPVIDLYGKSLVCLLANTMGSGSTYRTLPNRFEDLGSTVNCNLLSLRGTSCAIDLELLLLPILQVQVSVLVVVVVVVVAIRVVLGYSIKGFGLT